MQDSKLMDRVRSTGIFRTVTNTPGWVWVVIGGVVLLIVGVVAATAAMHARRPSEE